jgi:hypothetical protein
METIIGRWIEEALDTWDMDSGNRMFSDLSAREIDKAFESIKIGNYQLCSVDCTEPNKE